MKKTASFIIAAVFAAAALPALARADVYAESYTQGGLTLTYTVSGSEASITGISGSGTVMYIPETISGYTVTSIAAEAFSDCAALVNVTIPDSVRSIGEKAFWFCSSLNTVYFWCDSSYIGDYAFSACPSLSALFFPVQGFLNAMYFTLRSGGKTFVTFLFDSVFSWVVAVPAALMLCRFTELPILGIYAIVQAADIIKVLFGNKLIKIGIWISNLVSNC